MSKKSQPEIPLSSPIPFSTGSNGEVMPAAASARALHSERLYWQLVDHRAQRLGIDRRTFVESGCGTALALMVINTMAGCTDEALRVDGGAGSTDGGRARELDGATPDARPMSDAAPADSGYAVDADTTYDAGMACERLSGDEFIFDVQTHHVNPGGAWRQSNRAWELFLASLPQGSCGSAAADCFSRQHYLRELFINSDTHMAVLSAVPADVGSNPLEIADATETVRITETLADSERLITHGLVLPDRGTSQLDAMQRLAEDHRVAAWKVYTPYGAWRLDDPTVGIPFIERARSLGIKRICAHKGLPLAGFDRQFADPVDIGIVAAMYPDVTFIVYHSGYDPSFTEGPYDESSRDGVDRLIHSLRDNNIAPNGNVYAELGTTWRSVMSNPTEAAHVIGKLLVHVGQDRLLWGTDSIWYGSPQDQIMAFRAFEISPALQAMQGYPALTPALKAKILGLNAANAYGIDAAAKRCAIDDDELTRLTMDLGERRLPTWRNYGPRTRREMFAFLRARDGMPG